MEHDTRLDGLGSRICTKRISLKMTMLDVRKETGIQQSQLSMYENNVQIPNLQNLSKIAICLCVSIQYLIYGKEYDKGLDLRGLTESQTNLLCNLAKEFRHSNVKHPRHLQGYIPTSHTI